ncbi:MAG: serine hydrolase domain-containing protein, partial [Anaerolineaceae bacterium]
MDKRSFDKLTFIENHLQPAFQIEGQRAPEMTLADRMAHYNVPGVSLAVVENGEIAFSKAYGLADAETGQPAKTATLFQAASISKPVSALAAMALVQAGKLDLDADVNSVLKSWQVPDNEFTQTEKVTLRRLLSHNAGLTVHGFPGYAKGVEIPTIQQVLLGQPPANTGAVVVDVLPGSIWRYSGGGTTVAQLLMMETTGLTHAELMQQYVLGPAGMVHSTYQQPLPAERHAEASTAHSTDGKPVPGKWHIYPEQAAAGLWTTPEDLCRYVIAVQKSLQGQPGAILSPEVAKEMLRVQFGSWGLGPQIKGQGQSLSFSHGGSNEGFRCEMMGYAHTGQGIAVMTNSDNGSGLCQEILRAAARAYGWEDFLPPVKPALTLADDVLQTYTGVYAFPEQPEVTFTVACENGRLVIQTPVMPNPLTLHA